MRPLAGLDDETLLAQMARELEARDPAEVVIAVTPASLLQLASLVQLACRHPSVAGRLRDTADQFFAGVRGAFADAPAVLEVLSRGERPAHDQARHV